MLRNVMIPNDGRIYINTHQAPFADLEFDTESQSTMPIFNHSMSGILQYGLESQLNWIQIQCVLIACHILCYDIWFYISHLVLHLPWCFQNIHYIHHQRRKDLRYYDAYHNHILETLFQSIGFFIPLIPQIGLPGGFYLLPVFISLVYINIKGMIQHDIHAKDYDFVKHHLRHHTNFDVNYGEYWLDYLCGTLHDENIDKYKV
jgi:sterol desaturase/sphingolipid hydroxylase (fatty acid hydroxylase superfamily)